ncbi:MAG TPA: glycosyltransferase family 4 protein [Candidatus Methylacidiphilales bacterium]|jgi:hypothetical protein|nr:glycosyltransferase family 4 protein [Candidatus Methylacidiphilales bacterium]
MKICWFVPDDRGGGVISVALSCVRQARAAGHDAVLLLMLEPSGWLDGVPGIRTVSLGLKHPAIQTPPVLMQWLAENPQDVLLLNGGEEADTIIPYLPADVRCIYTVHDTAARYWQTAVAAESDLDGIISVSHTVSGKFGHMLKNPRKLQVIHNGSSFPVLPDFDGSSPDDLVFFGGSEARKGAPDLLRLWPMLVKMGFSGRLHWLGSLEPAFERRISELPQENRILRPGRLRREDVFLTAGRSKVVLMLSRVEPFGMATIEGMSMGCVPVAWDIETGTKEIVTDDTGFFVPLGNFTELARKVLQACAEHAQIAPRSSRRAREIFSEEMMWQGYDRFIGQVMQNPPRPRSLAGGMPPDFVPIRRRFQLLPASVRKTVRDFVGRSPWLGYLLRDLRGL